MFAGKAEGLFQLANMGSLGFDGGFKGSYGATPLPSATEGCEKGQDNSRSYRAENDQYQRGLVFPEK